MLGWSQAPRMAWVDTCRGLGMLLVYYGHLTQQYMAHKVFPAFGEVKFVYSFHMPLFFLLSGFMYRPRVEPMPRLAAELALRRVVPLLFFNVIALVLHLVLASPWIHLQDAWRLALGWPVFNPPMWFLSCLVTVELLHEVLVRVLRAPRARVAAALLLCTLGAVITTAQGGDEAGPLALAWYWTEALVAYGFYFVGVALQRVHVTERGVLARLLAAGLLLGFTALTFRANSLRYVNMLHFHNGDPGWFFVTALAGALGTWCVASLWPIWAWLTWIGRHSLPLLGLGGLVHIFLNGWLAGRTVAYVGASHLGVALVGGAVVAATMLACAPLAWALTRGLPQLVGQPRVHGPLLPALLPKRPAE